MPTRNPAEPNSSHSPIEQPPAGSPLAQALNTSESAPQRSNKAARAPPAESQMRRRADELRALLRDLD